MRSRTTLALLALAALTCGCGAPSGSGTTIGAPLGTTTPAPTPTPAVTAEETTDAATIARCTADDLTLTLGEPDGEGQRTASLIYTNSSDRPCEAWGVPGVDLVGPDDPNGPTYSLSRPGADESQPRVTLGPGDAATAPLTYLTDSPGSVGSLGSTGWVPTQLVTTPPGDTEQLTVPWTSGDTVLRQDSATRPGSFVGHLG